VRRHGQAALDEGKQAALLAIISVGCSQTMAANYVGCSPRTIRRLADRDERFARRLREAKGNAELGLVKNIRKAANKEQYWRAAAWALERMFPEKYARRGPDVITLDQLAQVIEQLMERVMRHVPVAKYRKNIVKDIESLVRSFGQTVGPGSGRVGNVSGFAPMHAGPLPSADDSLADEELDEVD
jgi:hypothetical protein